MRVLILFAALLSPALGQTLSFSPQGGSRVAIWAVSGCVPKPVPIAAIYAIATRHGINWLTPQTAAAIYRKRSPWSRAVRIAGFAAAGGSALMSMDVVQASRSIQTGLLIGGTLLTVLMPLAQREVPTVDPTVDLPLLLGPDGCGQTSFYALPSNVAAFVEEMK